jgi:hypothetical protein
VTHRFLLVTPLFPLLTGCGLLSTDSHGGNVEVGTVHVVAFDRHGVPAAHADVIVHDADGQLVSRAILAGDGTGEVESVAGATVSVAIRASDDVASLLKESGEITSFTDVPLDATIHVGKLDPARGAAFDVTVEVPVVAGSPFYEVSIGCGREVVQDGPTIVLHVPADCASHARTLVATAFTPGFDPAATSVLRGVDLHDAGAIDMPAFEPLHGVEVITTGHDSNKTFDLGTLEVINDDGAFEFVGDDNLRDGHVPIDVPGGDWDFTHYSRELVFDGAEELTISDYDRTDAGAPATTEVAESDFLAPPVRGEGELGFAFDADVDARSLQLTYRCFKCNARGRWTLFGPSSQEPFVLPEMPEDLIPLTPKGAAIDSIEGWIFENSEQDGYGGFVNAGPEIVPGAVHRAGLVVLLSDAD